MAGISALSVNPKEYKGEFALDFFLGQFYLQHLDFAEKHCGFSVCRKGRIETLLADGLLRPNFGSRLKDLSGLAGIGYCGYFQQPFQIEGTRFGDIAICFSGNILNAEKIKKDLLAKGAVFGAETSGAEIALYLIASSNSIVNGIKRLAETIEGSCSLLILCNEGIYVFQLPGVYSPLVIGEKEGAVVVSSESVGFPNTGFVLVKDVNPGEIILLKNGKWEVLETIKSSRDPKMCTMVWAFNAFSGSCFKNNPVSLVRKKMGAILAKRDIEERSLLPDVVCPVPNIGRIYALGYYGECCRLLTGKGKLPCFDEPLAKYTYAGRGVALRVGNKVMPEIDIKMIRHPEDHTKESIVVCTDSIVTGRRLRQRIIPWLKEMGFSEIHLRVAFPEIVRCCQWMEGIKRGKLLAILFPAKEDRAEFLGVNSVEHNTIEDFVKAIGMKKEEICLDCVIR